MILRAVILFAVTAVLVTAVMIASEMTVPGEASAPDARPRPPRSVSRIEPITAESEAQRLVEEGLAALVATQNADGSFGARADARVGTTAIACLALLADGNTERRGRYHEASTRAVKYLMSCALPDGERRGYISANGDTVSRMHGHGLATLALAQAYGTYGVGRRHSSTSKDLGRLVRRAVDIIVRSQSRAGGWFYEPFDELNDEGSITVCMVQALRAARECGFHVPKRTIDQALLYVRNSQNEDGSFRYRLIGNEQTSFELTAASCSTLAYGGRYFGSTVRNARDFLWNRELDSFLDSGARYPYYGLYYATLTLWFDYDESQQLRRFNKVWPRFVAWYSKHWNPTSAQYEHTESVGHAEMEYGPVYRTAFATLTLQIPDETLPTFRR